MPRYELPTELSTQLEELIAQTTAEIEAALVKLRAGVAAMQRFANMEDIAATVMLLEERGEPMHMNDIIRELKRGGLWRGPSTSRGGPDSNMKRSIARFASRNRGRRGPHTLRRTFRKQHDRAGWLG